MLTGAWLRHRNHDELSLSQKNCSTSATTFSVYGRGTGAECRKHVQSLNKLRSEIESCHEEKIVTATNIEQDDVHLQNFQIDQCEVESNIQCDRASKWEKYIEPLVNEDGNDEEEDDERFTTDRKQYQTANRHYRKQKRENYRQYKQNQSKERHGWNSRWQSQTNNYPAGQECSYQFNSEVNPKRLPENCLVSKPAKRAKCEDFQELQNEDVASTNGRISKENTNFHSAPSKDASFSKGQFERKPNTDKNSNGISHPMPEAPKKKSKWDAFVCENSEEESELYIPETDNSSDFELNSDPSICQELEVSEQLNDIQPSKLVLQNFKDKCNAEKETSNVVKCERNSENVPKNRANLFQVDDFDDVEFEFTI